MASTEIETPPVKRGRGRPRKIITGEPSGLTKPSTPSATPGVKRGRGRPRKVPADPQDQSTPPPKRPRGRPRLSDANGESVVKKKRGRPRKSDATPAADRSTDTSAKSPFKLSNASPTALDSFSLDKIVGSYEIQCEEVQREWPTRATDMGITIEESSDHTPGLIASFNLGIIEGKMLIATDEESLAALRRHIERPSHGQLSDDLLQRDVAAADASKIRNRQVIFAWQGRDNGDTNEVYPFRGTHSVGHLKFLDDEATRFEGEIDAPALGQGCRFSGSRTEWEDYHVEGTWADFSERAYEEANINRWR
jgi:hypothetical protein